MTQCPFHPFSAEYQADPYPTFAAVREEAPAFYIDELDMWVVTRYREAAMVMSDTELFSASNSQDPLLPFCPEAGQVLAEGFGYVPVMTNLDPPEHARIRRHNMTAFSAKRVANLEPAIRAMTNGLLDELLANDPFDWVSGLAYPLPISVIFELVGFPQAELSVFGSVARGEVRPESDVDLLFVLAPDARLGFALFDLGDELAEIFGREVELLSKDSVHRLIRDAVLAESQLLYAA